jgi:long-chain acyl-CoA synthetase
VTSLVTASTLSRRAEEALERLGDHRSLFFEGTWQTSGELAARARRAAAGFTALGVRPGDRVVLFMANCPEVGIAYSALWRAGAVATPVLFLLTEDELRHVLQDSGAVAIVTTPEFLPKILTVADGLPVVVVGGDGGTTTFAELEAGDELPLVDRTPEDLPRCSTPAARPGEQGRRAHPRRAGRRRRRGLRRRLPSRSSRRAAPLPLAHVYGLMVSVTGLHALEPASRCSCAGSTRSASSRSSRSTASTRRRSCRR